MTGVLERDARVLLRLQPRLLLVGLQVGHGRSGGGLGLRGVCAAGACQGPGLPPSLQIACAVLAGGALSAEQGQFLHKPLFEEVFEALKP